MPNPFATVENGHRKIMYRTGDLARFRADGEIEYLGRIDTQVKIRGLRIELGEIESVMSRFPRIQLNAVADKRDENNRQCLVGYYTSETSVDETELRKYLSAKLPKHMVPNYFVRLGTMPMTASGKTDRKNLPLPDFSISTREYIEPETEAEKKLAVIWRELLQLERVGKTEDFFDLGGDSLLAITMINRVEEVFHTEISVKEIMEHSVLEQLAQAVEGTKRESGNSVYELFTIQTQKTPDKTALVFEDQSFTYRQLDSFFIEQPMDNVYVHSKFEAEKVVFDAMLDGLEAKIIRVGNLTNRMTDFKFQPKYTQNAFLTRVKAILEFGLLPDYLMPLYTEFSPVDLTARAS